MIKTIKQQLVEQRMNCDLKTFIASYLAVRGGREKAAQQAGVSSRTLENWEKQLGASVEVRIEKIVHFNQ